MNPVYMPPAEQPFLMGIIRSVETAIHANFCPDQRHYLTVTAPNPA